MLPVIFLCGLRHLHEYAEDVGILHWVCPSHPKGGNRMGHPFVHDASYSSIDFSSINFLLFAMKSSSGVEP
jgi:hypothetical protein